MPDDLRPPPESAHFEFHWLRLTGEKASTLCPVAWNSSDGGYWDDDGKRWDGVASYQGLVWSYVGPCDPAALTINPEDAGQAERVARALWEDQFPDEDWKDIGWLLASSACGFDGDMRYLNFWGQARAALKALSDA